MADLRYIYWDANPFCAIFNNEAGRVDTCKAILKMAERGEIKIVSSSITLAEVIRIKGGTGIKPGKEAVLYDFFQNDFLIFVNVEWFVGTAARKLGSRPDTTPRAREREPNLLTPCGSSQRLRCSFLVASVRAYLPSALPMQNLNKFSWGMVNVLFAGSVKTNLELEKEGGCNAETVVAGVGSDLSDRF
jgi:hypothetical protein